MHIFYRPQRSWGKVLFLHVSVILFGGGGVWGVVSQHALQVVSQYALQVSRPTPRGEVEGSGQGGLQAHTQGRSWGVWPRGVSRPTPGGSPGPHLGGGLQTHTWGVSRPTPGGVSRPIPREGVSQHELRQTLPPPATAVGGTHPTGMHSCYLLKIFIIIVLTSASPKHILIRYLLNL